MNSGGYLIAAPPGSAGRLAYLSLEMLAPGGAANTHVTEMIAGLETRGWAVSRFVSRAAGGGSPLRRLPEHWRVLGRVIRRMRGFDVLYVRSHPFAWPAAIAAKCAGVAVVHEVNGVVDDLGVTYPWLRFLLAPLVAMQTGQYRAAAALFAVTPGLVVWTSKVAPDRPVHLVPNAANLQVFTPEGPRHAHPRAYAVFVGSLARWHGVETMLMAARDPAWPADVDLLVAGEGLENAAMTAAEAALPRLVWLRRQAQSALPPLLRGALAALVPISNPDGRSGHGVLPLKLYEAMACGAPVVVTDLPGQADLVRETGAGLVVPVDDAPALAAAVARLRADPPAARGMGQAGAAAAHRCHGWQNRADRVHRVLTGLRTRAAAA